ncbi:MAG: histidine kinase [Sphingobacteriales bacterium]|nr:histidine kinase [Sphingobacteriales bacterium]
MKSGTVRQNLIFYSLTGITYLLLFLTIAYFTARQNFLSRSINTIWRTVYFVLIYFAFFEYAIPAIKMVRKKKWYSFLVIAAMLLLCTFGWYAFRRTGIILQIYTSFIHYPTALTGIFYQSVYGLFSILFFGVSRHIFDHSKLRRTIRQQVIEKKQAELNYLKAQTTPHFLFDTLNNIYSLSQEKSDLAPESILRLSKILRCMLYDTNVPYIPLEQEWKIIEDYIDLQKLRYDDSLRINLSTNFQDMKHQLPPLLLMGLVQNAFKQGLSETGTCPFLDIHLSVDEQEQMTFIVRNSTDDRSRSPENIKNMELTNLRLQLELHYTEHKLILLRNDSWFTATLKINLSNQTTFLWQPH